MRKNYCILLFLFFVLILQTVRLPAQTLPTQDAYTQQCVEYIELNGLANSTKKSFLRSANSNPKASLYQDAINCIADMFTPQNLAPYYKIMVIDYLSIDDLTELNKLFKTAIGQKVISICYTNIEHRDTSGTLTNQDQKELIRIASKPFWKAYTAFTQNGMPRFVGKRDVISAVLRDFKMRCNTFPHPW
jgi:hypothetical protein